MTTRSRVRRVLGRIRRGPNHSELVKARQKVSTHERTIAKLSKENASLSKSVAEAHVAQTKRFDDIESDVFDIIELVRPFTMTSEDKLIALIFATRHIARTGLSGAIVECGVWRGGSMHAIARTLAQQGVTDRDLYLFDTFTGMTEPTERDVRVDDCRPAAEMLDSSNKTKWIWAIASREDVENGLAALPYPQDRFHLVEGPVEETLQDNAPEKIALLRLDTDWYESTAAELEHLYSRLVPGGVLIIDDYGSWQGSKEATDEFFSTVDNPPLLHRAGRGRIGIKPA